MGTEGDESFPSGDACESTMFGISVVSLRGFSSPASMLALFLAALSCFGRVYFHAHNVRHYDAIPNLRYRGLIGA
ncbi:hypothetical protein Pmar_PMAR019947 [Perkinsus marinus ATCC 50983]|uniref:Uncharacterized protein n=1 Tax=Perkinsus marinus (strain ATCC 50983 / TXsc) TaxID=423536 RepID=C5KC34_PERM5|nr:hypothetical protein Pmar_PMAR019947 [Perkinsus marinus ATCC 50983]EER18065.1 hypothetical protein Pmar_PMAR019947 [Perkinsus marinus ATCC 50983]|eukprot:XP_002786269.1 hypothetical protein Pmar_PMAR019947 [Perkinsus marinus ATCC 50983]